MDDDGGTVAAGPSRLSLARFSSGSLALSSGVAFADRDQRVSHPLVERRSIMAATAGSGGERGLDDDVLVLWERPGQGPASIVEAEEAPGEGTRGTFVGLVPGGLGELADLLGRPMRGLFSQLCVRHGLGYFDEGFYLVEGELPLRERIGDLGERR